MDIKEIALKICRGMNPYSDLHESEFIYFANKLIKSYKAEVLNEVGEPVLYAEFAEDGGWLGDASEYADHLEEPHALFTSEQVATAVLKATKPLEDRIKWLQDFTNKDGEVIKILEDQLAKAEQLWQVAQGRCDGLEEKLAKAEQRVAEAVWKAMAEGETYEDILVGEWRKFLKEM